MPEKKKTVEPEKVDESQEPEYLKLPIFYTLVSDRKPSLFERLMEKLPGRGSNRRGHN